MLSSFVPLRVLVTGAAGFVGGHLVAALAAAGHHPVGFDLLQAQDICDAAQVDLAVGACDVVVHLAAWADLYAARENPVEAVRVNVLGTAVVAEAAARHGVRLVHGSTACVYGNQPSYPCAEDAAPNPTEIYAQSKLAAEQVVQGLVASAGLDAVWVRFSGVYGERLRGALAVARFFEAASRGEALTVHGDGLQTRAPIHVADLVAGLLAVIERPEVSGALNLGTSDEISALALAQRVIALAGGGHIVHVEQRLPQTWREHMDTSRAAHVLGWQPQVSLEEGLLRTWRWWQERHRPDL